MSLSVGMAGVIFTQTGLPNVQIAYHINPTPRVTLITAVSSAVCPSSRAKLAAFVDIAWSRSTGLRCIISYIFHCLRLTLTFQLWSGSAFQPTTLKPWDFESSSTTSATGVLLPIHAIVISACYTPTASTKSTSTFVAASARSLDTFSSFATSSFPQLNSTLAPVPRLAY